MLLQGVWQPGPVVVLGEPIGLERVLAVLAFTGAWWAINRGPNLRY